MFNQNNSILFPILFIAGIMTVFSGCASSFTDCSKLAGTTEYDECLASKGDQEAQYQIGLAAYQAGDTDTAIKWLEKAAAPQDRRTPIFIPTGGDNFRIEMRETGLSEVGHIGAQRLLAEIYEDDL